MAMSDPLVRVATNAALAADVWSGWSTFDSRTFARAHNWLVSTRPERPAEPIAELNQHNASRERVIELSADFTRPLVIRGAIADRPAVGSWNDPSWWTSRYPDTPLLCATPNGSQMVRLADALNDPNVYVAGATTLFERHPELKDMVESELTRQITPDQPQNTPQFYQAFIGRRSQGTTVHCAIGINLFRQVSGRKRWHFLPPSETPFVFPKVYSNGYSATSRTVQPHGQEAGSPWFARLQRYEVTLEPGDLLINPPWWWHCVENVESDDELIVGVPTRFTAGRRAVRVDPFKTAVALSRVFTGKSGLQRGKQDPAAFERSLMANRDETDQQLVLRPGSITSAAPPAEGAVDAADGIFHTFRRLFPQRRMMVTVGLQCATAPDLSVLRKKLRDAVDRHPRLGWQLIGGRTPRWSATPFSLDHHLVERVVPAAQSLGAVLTPIPVREGRQLPSDAPPWCLEVLRNADDPTQASLHALRLTWDHALTDMEGAFRLLLELDDAPAAARAVHPAICGPEARPGQLLTDRLKSRNTTNLRLSEGSPDVRWRRVSPGLSAERLDTWAARFDLTPRELLVAVSGAAYARYRAESGATEVPFDILAPSYSDRNDADALVLGNHHRSSARFAVPARPNDVRTFVTEVGRQAREVPTVPYGRTELLAWLPDAVVRKVLGNTLPPVIVNQDAPQLLDRLRSIGGANVTDVAVAAPLLPHQQCSFVWFTRDGQLHCGLATDTALVADAARLEDALQQAVAELLDPGDSEG